MKKTILTLVASIFMIGAILISCNTPAEKVEIAEDNVAEANKQLDEANQAYLADIEAYKQATAAKIEANTKSITEFNARIEKDKKSAKVEYAKKIAELEQKNTDMKKNLDDYKAEGKDKWETFKEDFSRRMDELGNSIKDLTSK